MRGKIIIRLANKGRNIIVPIFYTPIVYSFMNSKYTEPQMFSWFLKMKVVQ
jgi:hypothetical protein